MRKSRFITLAVGAILLISGCKNIGGNTSADGKAYLSFSVSSARSLNPSVMTKEDVKKVELEYKKTGEEDYAILASAASLADFTDKTNLSMSPGKYDFLLKLYTLIDKDYVLCQQGAITEKVLERGLNKLEFFTDYVSDSKESGLLDLYFEWPVDSGITKVEAGLYLIAEDGTFGKEYSQTKELTINSISEKAETNYSIVLPAGNYWLKFLAYQVNDHCDVYSNIVKIKAGCSTKNRIVYDGANTWKPVGEGDVIIDIDNAVMNIEIDKTDGKVYLNDTIHFSAKNYKNVDLSEWYLYGAKLLYKGKDINEISDEAFYAVDYNKKTLKLIAPLPKMGTYQLYIAACSPFSESDTRDVYSSRMFNVSLETGYVTPETSVALYQKDNLLYSIYMVDPDEVEYTSLSNPVKDSIRTVDPLFDAFGNLYTSYFYGDGGFSVFSTNSAIGVVNGVYIEDETAFATSGNFRIDLANNTAYAYGYAPGETTFYLIKYPYLILGGSSSNPVSYSISVSGFFVNNAVVNNDMLYVLGKDNSDSYQIRVYDISDGLSETVFATLDVTEYLQNVGLTSSDNITINDIYALEGAVYLLVKECSYSSMTSVWKYDTNTSAPTDIYNRGLVIKYEPPAVAGGNAIVKHIGLKNTAAYERTVIPKLSLYYESGYDSPIYSEKSKSSPALTIDGSAFTTSGGSTLCNTYFPSVYALSNKNEYFFSAPQKVVAIKPKKLIIADDGLAFYTDNDVLAYKNINRIVTIDLKDFVIESIQSTPAKFDSDLSVYLRSNITLYTLVGTGTYYDNSSGYWFEASGGGVWNDINWNTDKNNIRLSIKNGDN